MQLPPFVSGKLRLIQLKVPWRDLAKFFSVLAGSLLFNLPLFLFKYGTTGIISFCLMISSIYLPVAVLEVFRYYTILPGFSSGQSLNRRLKIAFILTLTFFIANVVDEFFPKIVYHGEFRTETFASVGGLLYGMLTGLLVFPPGAKVRPKARMVRKYWTRLGLVLGIVFGIVTLVTSGFSYLALLHGFAVMFAFVLGLGLGLQLGRRLNEWLEAFEPTLALLRRMAQTLFAYGAGFVIIVLLFASFFAASWKLEGAGSFRGIPATPTFTTFIYFSLLTATTVGSDIVPLSHVTRTLTSLESMVALAWTLVVFAAISVQFSDVSRTGTTQSDPSTSDSSTRKEDGDSE